MYQSINIASSLQLYTYSCNSGMTYFWDDGKKGNPYHFWNFTKKPNQHDLIIVLVLHPNQHRHLSLTQPCRKKPADGLEIGKRVKVALCVSFNVCECFCEVI